ncbi:hypothetical protein HPB47_015180 [Ixodes persulcatus]|uniref:Uncharacterized protein n=1 Tax=Ixodes persulcatus TaxID=34615 RepID=A0AC60QU60_IXOPE|nr:hypothetical protein HPB47_015180 [Ixodes persulcatus]
MGELRVMLADERHSNQQHRIDLDKLKAAHVSLQEDYVRLQKDLRDALQSIQDVRANHANILQRADKVITQKDAIIKDIRVQTVCKFRQEVGNLSLQLSTLEEEKLKLKGQLADSEQRHKAELLQLKLDTVKQKAELESTHRKAAVELTNAKLDAELALKTAIEQKRTAAEKEKETERRHQLTRTKDWDRARQLESEKVLLEAQLSEVATAKAAADQRLMEAEKQMKRLKQAQESQRQELEEEMLALRARLKASLAVREDTNKVAAENHVLRQKLELLEEERRKDRAAIEGTTQQKDGLSETVERLKSELQVGQQWAKWHQSSW